MELKKAQIARSLAGHDRGEVFCVMDVEGAYLLLADGKGRGAQTPKRKKHIHAAHAGQFRHPVLEKIEQGLPVSDNEIRRALAAFRAQLRRV